MVASKSTNERESAPPYSFTDIVRALRELIGLVRDTGKLIGKGAKLYDRSQARKAATDLSALAFTPRGIHKYLQRVATGAATSNDFAAIAKVLKGTAGKVDNSVWRLGKYRKRLRENNGMAAAQKLDEIIYGPNGKRALRFNLNNIARMSKSVDFSRSEVRTEAEQALGKIAHLNADLRELHDLILQLEPRPLSRVT